MNFFDDFDKMFYTPFFSRNENAPAPAMKTDIREKDGLYLMSVDLPGYDKENIKAQLKDGYLTISAEKNDSKEETDEKGYIRRERYQGSCSRSYFVGENVKEDDIKAAYKDGILHLSFPKEAPKQVEETKYIAIE
jgi:HSP20 family molecular chaperone IbpA